LLFLQTAAEQPSLINLAWPFLAILAIYYFIVIMPTRRNQKKVQDMIENLKVGDKVITNSGIYGTIAGLKQDRIQIRIAENVKVEMSRNAVTALQNPDQEQTNPS
jgi:preprotein translocase subunit YajC